MSGRSITSQQPWQIVHSGRELRRCEGRRLTRKTEAVAVVTLVLPRNSKSGRGDWIRTLRRRERGLAISCDVMRNGGVLSL
jgi:hypothetical protein